MGSKIKIPTLLGLGILTMGLVVSIILTGSRQVLLSRAGTSANPKNINVVNMTSSSVSIYWNTDEDTSGFVRAGSNSTLDLTFKDDRDDELPQNHKLHFVTLTNLTPNTLYNYKIGSGTNLYPHETLSFKTAPKLNTNSLTPLIGSVLDATGKPITESFLLLYIDGAQSLATVTKVAGNFILPLKELRTQDLNQQIQIPENGISATLEISNIQQSSKVTLKLPLADNILPPLTLGQDLDLTPKPASPSGELKKFDLNNDGIINALDASMLLSNFSTKPRDKKLDLNRDGVVDKKDVDLISKYVTDLNAP